MKIKIFQHKDLKINYADDLPKVVQFFKSKGVDVEFTAPTITDIMLPETPWKLYLPNDNGQQDVLMYIFDRQQRSKSFALNFSKTLQVIEVSTSTQDDAVDYTWKLICHELMHTLFQKQINKGIFLNDPMDSKYVKGVLMPYYKNETPYAPDGNFAAAFKILAPYLTKTVTITRGLDNGWQTIGKLTTTGFTCDTLERPWLNNKPNISCIPKGTYQCRWSFSPKFLKYTYEVLNVPKRSGIRIHTGNYFFDIQGCILLGQSYKDINKDGKVDILNSKVAIKKFEDLLNRQPFLLVIL